MKPGVWLFVVVLLLLLFATVLPPVVNGFLAEQQVIDSVDATSAVTVDQRLAVGSFRALRRYVAATPGGSIDDVALVELMRLAEETEQRLLDEARLVEEER